jgi:hypothetical protein
METAYIEGNRVCLGVLGCVVSAVRLPILMIYAGKIHFIDGSRKGSLSLARRKQQMGTAVGVDSLGRGMNGCWRMSWWC